MAFLFLPINLPPASPCSAAQMMDHSLGPALPQELLLHTHTQQLSLGFSQLCCPRSCRRGPCFQKGKKKDKNLIVLPCVG